ncbi:MAG: response regulator [Thaumarchaeota archaeon]|nr:MAG: response regulator [Nitrososphaerota archaeon]
MRILVAEDEVVTVELYAAVLEERGHKVIVTYDGRQCLNTYRSTSKPFDVVILDYKMPLLDGMQVAKEIFKINPDQRIIFTSAYVVDTLADSVNDLKRVVELVQKPFLPQLLVEQVEDASAAPKLRDLNSAVKDDEGDVDRLLERLKAIQKPKTI